jgi:hypothetical protein
MYYNDDNSLLSKLDRKIGKFAVPNLALILVIAMGFVYIVDYSLAIKGMPLFQAFYIFTVNLF